MNIFAELSKNDFKMEISRSEDTQINRRESPETHLDTGKDHAKTGGGETDKMDSLINVLGHWLAIWKYWSEILDLLCPIWWLPVTCGYLNLY